MAPKTASKPTEDHSDKMCKNADRFCFLCACYIPVGKKGKKMAPNKIDFNGRYQDYYKKVFKVKTIKNLEQTFTPKILCSNCRKNLSSASNGKVTPICEQPAIWHQPNDDHSNCYLCTMEVTHKMQRQPKKVGYPKDLSVVLPVKKTKTSTKKMNDSPKQMANETHNDDEEMSEEENFA